MYVRMSLCIWFRENKQEMWQMLLFYLALVFSTVIHALITSQSHVDKK